MASDTPLVCECGSSLFWKAYRTGGWWKQLIHGDGSIEDTDLGGVRYSPEPKTIVCAECKKRHPNPKYRSEQ